MPLTEEQKIELESWMSGLAENRQEADHLDDTEERAFSDVLADVIEDIIGGIKTSGLKQLIDDGLLPEEDLQGCADEDAISALEELQ